MHVRVAVLAVAVVAAAGAPAGAQPLTAQQVIGRIQKHVGVPWSEPTVLVIGEAREWETVEYVADAVSAQKRKALIVLGHIPSEQAGMDECTRWLKTFVTEVPVEFVPARDPFWRP